METYCNMLCILGIYWIFEVLDAFLYYHNTREFSRHQNATPPANPSTIWLP
jgi:hypothetical protein